SSGKRESHSGSVLSYGKREVDSSDEECVIA
uniref:Movement protein n=1 Tax=Steinernema glaseri TaxID=37863 RepID=A0A1I8AHF2_9BILA